MRCYYFQLISILLVTSCSIFEDPSPEESPAQGSIPTGRAEYLPGTYVSSINFKYRIKRIDWISVWEDDTSRIEYFYNNDRLSTVQETYDSITYLCSYSKDTAYCGPSFSVCVDGRLFSKSYILNPSRIVDCSWISHKLMKIERDGKEYFLDYNSDGYLMGLHSEGADYSYNWSYEYFENNALKKIIYNVHVNDYEAYIEHVYSYTDSGFVRQIYNWGTNSLLSVYKFEYDDFQRLTSLKHESGPNIYEYRYYYESGTGNALYLYHPTYINIWPFDYYIGSVLFNIPTFS
jgi:hypothetical protein